MNRLKFKAFLWTILMITVFMTAVQPAPVTKSASPKTTKLPSRTTTTVAPSRPTYKSSSRNTAKPKNSKRTTTTTTTTISPEPAVEDMIKIQLGGSPSSISKKKQTTKTTTRSAAKATTKPVTKITTRPATKTTTRPTTTKITTKPTTKTTTTTTLSPIEIMNRLYQMHGMGSHSSGGHSSYHSHSHSHAHTPSSSSSSSSSSTAKKKPQKESSSSMDEIYRLHALAMAQSSSSNNKKGSDSSSSSDSNQNKNSIENIYQQHSSMPSSMHHILSQHSMQSQSSIPSRPEKTKAHPLKESSASSSLTTFVQPLLKQLTPVGAGISVVLAPLLLFNGFLTFFSNMSRFLNNFAQTILPARRPIGTPGQNTNQYFQNLGPAHLKRQPRDWLEQLQNMRDVHELTELIYKTLKESETHH